VAAEGSGGASDAEAREFTAAVRSLLEWVHASEGGARNEVAGLVQRVLGETSTAESVVTRQLPPFEQVNLQTALNAWSAQEGRQVTDADVEAAVERSDGVTASFLKELLRRAVGCLIANLSHHTAHLDDRAARSRR
jgi:hypothetical protein